MKLLKSTTLALCLSSLVGGSYAAAEHHFTGYDLPQNELVYIKGNIFSTRTLDCQVRSESTSGNTLKLVALKHETIINGVILPEGQTMTLKTSVGDHVFFEMEHNADLGATNLDEGLVNLDCK